MSDRAGPDFVVPDLFPDRTGFFVPDFFFGPDWSGPDRIIPVSITGKPSDKIFQADSISNVPYSVQGGRDAAARASPAQPGSPQLTMRPSLARPG